MATASDSSSRLGLYEARAIMARIGCDLAANFYTLDSAQVNRVLMEADQRRYRAPKQRNGSRARYFFQYVQRTAQRAE